MNLFITQLHTRQRSLKSMGHWIKWIREHGESVPIYSSMTTISRLTFLFDKTRKIERGIEKKNNHRNLSLVTWQQGGTDPSFGWRRTSVFPWGQGSKFDNTEAQERKCSKPKNKICSERFDNYSTRCRANFNICKL